MPSTTFYNLPAEKRSKLLQCARAEFARVSYPDASINKIIQAAEIPRGSFYMYFEDKNELFLFLIGTYARQFEEKLAALLSESGGDLFEAFCCLYDSIQAAYRAPGRDEVLSDLIQIFRRNHQMPPQLFLRGKGSAAPAAELLNIVDKEKLNLQDERDLEEIFYLLVGVTGAAILNGTLAEHPESIRARLVNIFEILKRGMVKERGRADLPESPAR